MSVNATEHSKRRRRFRREDAARQPLEQQSQLELQQRDLDIVTAVARHRFLNTDQACRLFACACPRRPKEGIRNGAPTIIHVKHHREHCACTCGIGARKKAHAPSCPALFKDDQHVASRLRELYQAGYLDRPVAQLQLRIKNGVLTSGSVPLVYAVTRRGLDLIGDARRQTLDGKLSWATKINDGGRLFMEHTLAIADMSIAVDLMTRQNPLLQRVSDLALKSRMPTERRTSARPWSLAGSHLGQPLVTICDLAFAIVHTEAKRRWNYLVEIDRGHMPIERATLTQTSILRKLIGYAAAHRAGLHTAAFGWQNFRVLVITTSDERVETCLRVARAHFGTSPQGRLFLFATDEATGALGTHTFRDIDGNGVCLADVHAA